MSEIAINTDIKVEKGIVGFFDILGYQSFLQNNTAEEAAKEVVTTINSIDSRVLKYFSEDDSAEAKSFVSYIEESIKWLIFSDTILITSRYYEEEYQNLLQWNLFILVACILCNKMFEFGLPVRGAISFGDFIKQEKCFAGRPIVEAYKTTTNLNLAACVLTESGQKEFESLKPFTSKYEPFFKEWVLKYLVPFKNNDVSMFTLRFLQKNDKQKDMRQMVLDSFWKHNKDIPISAHDKVDNTEKFLRFLISKG